MARPKLGTLLNAVEEARVTDPDPSVAADEKAISETAETVSVPQVAGDDHLGAAGEATPPKRRRRQARTDLPSGPKYLELMRKEVRFTDAQLDELTIVSRRLNKARRGSGERITDNTLIRVAVDLLLSQQSQLAGATEDELRKSVGL